MTLFGRAEILPTLAMLILSIPEGAVAQDAEPLMATCAIFDELRVIQEPDSFTVAEAVALTDEILEAVGLTRNFEVLASYDTDNAEAIILRQENAQGIGERFIIYNPDWVAANLSDSRWSVKGLLAHEIGHHLQGHTLDCGGSTPQKELETDRFAGNVLGKLGATERQAVELWEQLPEQGSETHPPRSERLAAVIEGWARGQRGNASLDFDLSNFKIQDCISSQEAQRDYSARIGPSGLPNIEISLSELGLKVVNYREIFSFQFEGDAIITTIEYEGRRHRFSKQVVDHVFHGPNLHVIATHFLTPSWAEQVFEEFLFEELGLARWTQYAVREWTSDGMANVREFTRVFRGCNYSGALGVWDQQ